MTDVWQRSEVTKQRMAEVEEELLQFRVNHIVRSMRAFEMHRPELPENVALDTWSIYREGEPGREITEEACAWEHFDRTELGPRGTGPDPASEPRMNRFGQIDRGVGLSL